MSISRVNASTWAHPRFVRHYRKTDLRPVEVMLLQSYEQFRGRVIELGCGTGRVTGHLVAGGAEVDAVDVSAPMLAEARRRHPRATFHLLDMRGIGSFAEASFDAVIATCNVLDVLDDDDRRAVLRDVRRLLRPDGILVFSSHNRGHITRLREPWQLPLRSPPRLVNGLIRLPFRLRNRRRLQPFVVHGDDYEILNDAAHDWRLLQYYIAPAAQRRQLADCGFELLASLTLDGAPVSDGEDAAEHVELHYVARPAA